ncbi:MAG TPA: SIS domain-containing protein [Coriobacteriia bacterium]|nr:SIS domain-containing protein [Coriobacteriia bacterium]
MPNFDEDRFITIQSDALAVEPRLNGVITALVAQGAENLFFLGAGGVMFLTQPAYNLLRTKSTFPVFYEMGAELVEVGNRHLGEQSIVVMPSLSGTTKEAIAALDYAKERGAAVITLTGHAQTPLAERADYNFTCFGEDDTSSEMYYLQTLLVALSVMSARGEIEDYATTVAELATLPKLLVEVKRDYEAKALALATAIKDDDYHIITGAGSTWPEAHYYGMCILEEMQWIRTRPVHASDFFHGALELVEEHVSVIVLKGEDETRGLSERVAAFAPRFTEKVHVLDTKEMELPGISEETRALISPVLLATVLERVSAHLEVLRDHPLTTRRYYKQLAY